VDVIIDKNLVHHKAIYTNIYVTVRADTLNVRDSETSGLTVETLKAATTEFVERVVEMVSIITIIIMLSVDKDCFHHLIIALHLSAQYQLHANCGTTKITQIFNIQ